jgi:hypothetical protein
MQGKCRVSGSESKVSSGVGESVATCEGVGEEIIFPLYYNV